MEYKHIGPEAIPALIGQAWGLPGGAANARAVEELYEQISAFIRKVLS